MIQLLMVGSSPEILDLGNIFLERSEEIIVDTAESAIEAMEKLDFKSYDIIVSAYEMPEMDGIILLRKVRDSCPDLPFIIFIEKAQKEVIIKAIENGANHCLQKCEDNEMLFAELEHQIRQAVAGYRAKKEIEHINNVLLIIRDLDRLILEEIHSENLLQKICNTLVETRGYHIAWIVLLDESRKFQKAVEAGLGEDFLPIAKRLKDPELNECVRKTLDQSEISIVEDPSKDCLCPFSSNCVSRGSFKLRLEHDGHIYGYISIIIPKELIGSKREHNLFKEIAEKIASALHIVKVEGARKNRQEQITIQRNLAIKLSEMTSLEEGIRICLETAIYASGMDCGALFFTDVDFKDLVLACTIGNSSDLLGMLDPSKSVADAAYSIMAGVPFYKRPIEIEPPWRDALMQEGIFSIAAIPIIFQDSVIGFFNLASHAAYEIPQEKREIMELIAGQVGNALMRIQKEKEILDAQKKLMDIIDFLPDATFVIDKDMRVIAWNRQIEAMTGIEKDKIIGKGDYSYAVPFYGIEKPMLANSGFLSDEEIECYYTNIRRLDNIICAETFAPALDGGVGRYLWCMASQLFDSMGYVVGAIESIRDITERKRVEEALRESEEKYRTLIERANDGITIIQDMDLKYVNPRLADMWGGTQEELIGTEFSSHIHPEEIPRIVEYYKRRFANKDLPSVYETVLKRKDGSYVDVELNAGLITFEGKSADLVLIRDISERKIAENAIIESEKKYRDLTELLPQSIYELDDQANVIFANCFALEKFGYTQQDLDKGLNVFKLFRPEDKKRAEENFKKALFEGKTGNEHLMLTKDGHTFEAVIYSTPIIQENGAVGLRGILFDISKRKLAERQIIAQRDLANQLLETNSLDLALKQSVELAIDISGMDCGGINLFDANSGKMVLAFSTGISNEFEEALSVLNLGSKIINLLMMGLPIYSAPQESENPLRDALLREGIKISANIPIFGGDRYIGTFHVASHSIDEISADKRNALEGIAAQVGNAIARLQAEEELRKSRDKLEDRVKERTNELVAKSTEMERFVYAISHDLMTPLVTIGGFVGLLRKDIENDDVENIEADLRTIEDVTIGMKELLDDTLELSRIGRVIRPPLDVPFGDIVQDALSYFSEKIKSRGIEVLIDSDFPIVKVDRLRIVQVLVNLIENSTKHIGEEGHPNIVIGQRIDDGETVFFVQDNGIGIDASQHEKVFDLFYKIDYDSQGSGAGLAIAKRIIDVHDSRIWIESKKGEGSTFCFTLPLGES
jgi:PAS domain S-box-containing protein